MKEVVRRSTPEGPVIQVWALDELKEYAEHEPFTWKGKKVAIVAEPEVDKLDIDGDLLCRGELYYYCPTNGKHWIEIERYLEIDYLEVKPMEYPKVFRDDGFVDAQPLPITNTTLDTATKNFFVATFNTLAASVCENAKAHGWHDEVRSDGEVIALMHAELSEALEALRDHNPADKHVPEFLSVEVELADAIIRIMDVAAERGYRVPEALIAKMKYNEGRPHRHGGKKF